MKILFLSWGYAPHIGGVEKHVQQVAQQLVRNGYEVTVLSTKIDSSSPQKETLQKVQVVRIPFNTENSKIQTWKWIISHREFFMDFDVIHAHDIFWWLVPILPFVLRKSFVTFHGWEGVFPVKKTAIIQRRIAAKLSRGIIQVGDYIEKWYGTVPDVLTYGAIDEMRYSKPPLFDALHKALQKSSDVYIARDASKETYTACFVGRLSKDNDVQKVVDVFSLYKEKHPHARFVFVGDGELTKICAQIGEVVGFTDQVEKYMTNSTFVCASSYLSVMEAQNMGKLVCAFYSNPLKKDYLIGYPQSHNMIVEDDPKVAFQEIESTLSNKEKIKNMLSIAKDWAHKQTWEKLTDQYIQLWKSKGIYIV